MNRRNFLKLSSSTVVFAAITSAALAQNEKPAAKRSLKKAIMLATVGFPGSTLEKFKAIKEAGFAGVEPMSHMNQDDVLNACKETGLEIASVCCATHWAKPLSDPNPSVRAEGLEGLR